MKVGNFFFHFSGKNAYQNLLIQKAAEVFFQVQGQIKHLWCFFALINFVDVDVHKNMLRMIILFQDASSSSKWSSICETCRSLFRAIYQNCTCKKFQWINATEKFARSQTFDKRQLKLQNYSQEKLEDFSSGFFTFISSIWVEIPEIHTLISRNKNLAFMSYLFYFFFFNFLN